MLFSEFPSRSYLLAASFQHGEGTVGREGGERNDVIIIEEYVMKERYIAPGMLKS